MTIPNVAEFPGNAVVFVPLNQLATTIDEIVQKALREKREEDLQEKFLSPEETCKLFSPNITVATLNNYEKQGLVKKHYLGRLTFYRYSEILESLKSLKKYSRQ